MCVVCVCVYVRVASFFDAYNKLIKLELKLTVEFELARNHIQRAVYQYGLIRKFVCVAVLLLCFFY